MACPCLPSQTLAQPTPAPGCASPVSSDPPWRRAWGGAWPWEHQGWEFAGDWGGSAEDLTFGPGSGSWLSRVISTSLVSHL